MLYFFELIYCVWVYQISVKEAKSCEVVHGGGRGDSSFSNSVLLVSQGAIDGSDSGKNVERRGGYGGPRTGSCGGDETRNLRLYELRSRTGHRNEYKREGSGQGNWGSQTDEISQVTEEFSVEGKKNLDAKKPSGEEDAGPGTKYKAGNVTEEKDPEFEIVTQEEFKKDLEEKGKALTFGIETTHFCSCCFVLEQ
ncbi:RGG repeats nuclear RNA binding protein A-like isoform X2 [Apium graveolens]|uniref:RGG repeats nuclear RNA binding protein A-like isoform X2 n=1 Tax=Apium graveolens TaxID=4045 RepID=UPI003D79F69F